MAESKMRPTHEAQKSITENLNVKYLDIRLINGATVSRREERDRSSKPQCDMEIGTIIVRCRKNILRTRTTGNCFSLLCLPKYSYSVWSVGQPRSVSCLS